MKDNLCNSQILFSGCLHLRDMISDLDEPQDILHTISISSYFFLSFFSELKSVFEFCLKSFKISSNHKTHTSDKFSLITNQLCLVLFGYIIEQISFIFFFV